MATQDIGDLLMELTRQWKSASPVKRGAVTQEQYWILKTVNEVGPLRIKDLAARLGCTPGSASITVKRMERDGLVARERSKEDERVVTVNLAEKGREKLTSWREEQLRSVSDPFDSLTRPERDELVRLLGKGLANAGVPTMVGSGGKRGR